MIGVTSRQRIGIGLAAVGALLCAPAPASAHLVTTGMGPVYDGIGHLLVSPDDLVPVLALALYAGLRGIRAGRSTMFALPLAWMVGGVAGSVLHLPASLVLPAASCLILGGLVAADLSMPPAAVAALAIAVGLVHGGLSGTVLREGPGTAGLVGVITMLFVLVTVAAAFVVSLKRPWTRVVVRVMGSWIAATGMLMFGWAMR